MKFFRKTEQDELQMGDVIRFKQKNECEYRYAIIAELPDGVVDEEDGTSQKYAAIILDNDGEFLRPGLIYRTSATIKALIKIGFDGWDVIEKAKTRTEDLTD